MHHLAYPSIFQILQALRKQIEKGYCKTGYKIIWEILNESEKYIIYFKVYLVFKHTP